MATPAYSLDSESKQLLRNFLHEFTLIRNQNELLKSEIEYLRSDKFKKELYDYVEEGLCKSLETYAKTQ